MVNHSEICRPKNNTPATAALAVATTARFVTTSPAKRSTQAAAKIPQTTFHAVRTLRIVV